MQGWNWNASYHDGLSFMWECEVIKHCNSNCSMALTCQAFWCRLSHTSRAAVGDECHHHMSCPSQEPEPNRCLFPVEAHPPDTASVNMPFNLNSYTRKYSIKYLKIQSVRCTVKYLSHSSAAKCLVTKMEFLVFKKSYSQAKLFSL